jgi:hypothetical protein
MHITGFCNLPETELTLTISFFLGKVGASLLCTPTEFIYDIREFIVIAKKHNYRPAIVLTSEADLLPPTERDSDKFSY